MLRLKRQEFNKGVSDWFASVDIVAIVSLLMLLAVCFYPEISLANASVENQLDKVNTLANGKVKVVGFSAAAILGGILAVIKGNMKLALIITGVGIFMSLYLEWVGAGMKLMNA